MTIIEMTGRRFGRLTVLARAPRRNGAARWLCHCDCGNFHTVNGNSVRTRGTGSCGCFSREVHAALLTTHAHGNHPLHNIWAGMIRRCTKIDSHNYDNYGGRGISVTPRWFDLPSFVADITAEIGVRPSVSHTLDRKDNDGNYESGNVRWATPAEQARNKGRFMRGYSAGILSMGT